MVWLVLLSFIIAVPEQVVSLPLNVPKLGDGCQHVFLDVGANRGVHVRTLFEPTKFKQNVQSYWGTAAHKSDAYKQLSQMIAGGIGVHLSKTRVCAFGFEANPSFTERLHALQNSYNKLGGRVKFFAPVAISDKEEKINFWRERFGWQLSGQTQKDSPIPGAFIKHEVEGIDLAKWLEDNIVGRKLQGQSDPNSVVMKLDIEGSEYKVLRRLLEKGLLCKEKGISAITLEFHVLGKDGQVVGNTLALGNTQESTKLTNAIKSQACTPTDMIMLDDETNLEDMRPLPTDDVLPEVSFQNVPRSDM